MNLKTTHNLEFTSRHYPQLFESETWFSYEVGTITGLWNTDNENYIILSFVNSKPGNGNLEDVFQWFNHMCNMEEKNLVISHINNERFYNHLIIKRGFVATEKENQLIKIFKNA